MKYQTLFKLPQIKQDITLESKHNYRTLEMATIEALGAVMPKGVHIYDIEPISIYQTEKMQKRNITRTTLALTVVDESGTVTSQALNNILNSGISLINTFGVRRV
jgi:hypothetical protein